MGVEQSGYDKLRFRSHKCFHGEWGLQEAPTSLARFGNGLFLHLLVALLFVGAAAGQMKNFGNRREGTQQVDNGKFDFLLVGLSRSFEHFGDNTSLKVRFAIPANAVKPIVTASELNIAPPPYAMESLHLVKAGEWYKLDPWPTSDVIDGRVSWDNLGVTASYTRGDHRVYSPVEVGQFFDSPGNTYRTDFRLGVSIQSLDVRVNSQTGMQVPVKVKGRHLSCDRGRIPDCTLWFEGDAQFVDLDFSGIPPGEYFVTLTGEIYKKKDEPAKLTFALYHRPAER